jgi:hypothetical protein
MRSKVRGVDGNVSAIQIFNKKKGKWLIQIYFVRENVEIECRLTKRINKYFFLIKIFKKDRKKNYGKA